MDDQLLYRFHLIEDDLLIVKEPIQIHCIGCVHQVIRFAGVLQTAGQRWNFLEDDQLVDFDRIAESTETFAGQSHINSFVQIQTLEHEQPAVIR